MDIMLDIETMGRQAGCVIRSIGAQAFDRSFEMGDSFYCNITQKSCLDLGLLLDPETVEWWSKQSVEATQQLMVDAIPIHEALAAFNTFFRKGNYERVWAQGSHFDLPIVEHPMVLLGMKTPWKFWNVRDTRTVYDVLKFDPKSVLLEGTYHNALDDARHQITCLKSARYSVVIKPHVEKV